ncbi:MAG: hypothetical protein Tsb002_36200 [Wenzhouxiangellaceae bacterium]
MNHVLNRIIILTFIALLLPSLAQAQRVCFSTASENFNADGPTFFAFPAMGLMDGGPVDRNGVVEFNLYIQPYCNNAGPVIVRRTQFFYNSDGYNYIVTPFNGNFVQNWAHKGGFAFIDTATGSPLLDVRFSNALLTSWTDRPFLLGSTLTLQDSERVDPNITFIAGEVLHEILQSADFPVELINYGEDFAFTLTNVREPGGGPIIVDVSDAGEYFTEWIAEGSFSATAGR